MGRSAQGRAVKIRDRFILRQPDFDQPATGVQVELKFVAADRKWTGDQRFVLGPRAQARIPIVLLHVKSNLGPSAAGYDNKSFASRRRVKSGGHHPKRPCKTNPRPRREPAAPA